MESRLIPVQQKHVIQIGRFRFYAADLAALLVFAAVGVYFFTTARYGITEADEAYYYSVAHRMMFGDKLLADECYVTDLTAVFWYLPYRVFYGMLGGGGGTVIAMRFLFASIKLIFFAAIYLSLRAYGYWAILAAVMYLGTNAFGLKTITYYSVCADAVLLAALILFIVKKPRPWLICAAGFLFGCAVVAEPSAALVWVVYTLLVLIRWAGARKGRNRFEKYSFIIDRKIWVRLLIGVAASFCCFMLLCAVFFVRAAPADVMNGLRQLARFSEYSPRGGLYYTLRIYKIVAYATMYGPVFFCAFMLCFLLAHFTRRYRKKAEPVFVVLMGVLYICNSAALFFFPVKEAGVAAGECVSHAVMFVLYAWTLFVFTENRNRKLGAFLIFSAAVSGCVDLISDCSFGASLMPGSVAAVLLFHEYARERGLFTGDGRKPARGVVAVALAAVAVFTPLYEIAHYGYMAWLQETERINLGESGPLDAVISAGPYKGIRTVAYVKDLMEGCERDMQMVRQQCENRFFVYGLAPSLYLSVDRPIATHCSFAYYVDRTEQTEYWWETYPEKRPDVVYIPFADLSAIIEDDLTPEEKLGRLRDKADLEVTDGEKGYIVKILSWHS